ncbi:MAG: hypothetical protein IKT58_03530 [Oscillospiraceae bacterium]|nr:hypothetical protein [Oscillospiraceae bacterium]
MSIIKRFLSILLAVTMLLALCPSALTQGSAAEEPVNSPKRLCFDFNDPQDPLGNWVEFDNGMILGEEAGLQVNTTDPLNNYLGGAVYTLRGENLDGVYVEHYEFAVDENGEYWKLINGTYTTVDPYAVIDGVPVDSSRYESVYTTYCREIRTEYPTVVNGVITVEVGEYGIVIFRGLSEGVYYLKQTYAPEGYWLVWPQEEFVIEISRDPESLDYEFANLPSKDSVGEITFVANVGYEFVDPPFEDENIVIQHSLDLAGDISLNFVIAADLLKDYDMDTVVLMVETAVYEGNEFVDVTEYILTPQRRGDYYYFTLTDLTAVRMTDGVLACFYGVNTVDGLEYYAYDEYYSIACYALSQMSKSYASDSLKTLCADLLRYGSYAQLYKGYRTDALAMDAMTPEQMAYLSDLNAVSFDTVNAMGTEFSDPLITWKGKTLALNNKVSVVYVVDVSNYAGAPEDLSLKLSYTNAQGQPKDLTLTESRPYGDDGKYYAFYMDALLAAELRTVLTAQVYLGETPVSNTLTYSPATYGKGKTGALLDLCKALFAYSDSAKGYFVG